MGEICREVDLGGELIMETFTLAAAIIAVVQWIKSVDVDNKVSGWITLPVALLLGALAGFTHFLGTVSIEAGLVSAFIAVGGSTLASKAGGTK